MASIRKNYIYNTLNTISGMLFPLITFPYVARVLMPEGIGLVNFYNAIINYITIFCSLGIPLYALRETAKVKNDKCQLSTTTSEILLLNIIFTLFGYVLVTILTFTVPQIKDHKLLFILMSSNILFVTIGCEWFYQGIEDFKYITIRSLIIKTICVILLFIFVKDKSDIIYYGLYL
ncbi:MAG: oligosaccharide flippase family protein, partial [Muribaculaceae bacterium]|nr:oligosaccharide flippase family protein [Muribaculaceae bacterium]